MGEGTSEIREEIEETRLRVGDEVDALSYKTDVGARFDDYVDDKKQAVTSKVSGAKDAVASAVGSVVPGMPSKDGVKERGQGVNQRGRRVKSMAHSNPIGLSLGAAALGFVVGLLPKSTKLENEYVGETADRVKQGAAEAGQEAFDHGKDIAQSAMQTVREEGAEHGRELASDLRDRVQQEPSGTTSPPASTSLPDSGRA